MSLVALAGDTVSITEHGCGDSATCESVISDVLVGGVGVHYVGGRTTSHMYNSDCDESHLPSLDVNTSTVYVYPNGTPVQIARAGDKYTGCGSIGASLVNYTVYAY